MLSDELNGIVADLEAASKTAENLDRDHPIEALRNAIETVGKSWGGSWLGYQSKVYYAGLKAPPPGANFSIEWGLMDTYASSLGSNGAWEEFDADYVRQTINELAGNPDLTGREKASAELKRIFDAKRAEVVSILETVLDGKSDTVLRDLSSQAKDLEALNVGQIIKAWAPRGQLMSRDSLALTQGYKVPPHLRMKAEIAALDQPPSAIRELLSLAKRAASHLSRIEKRGARVSARGSNVFIGHGGSPAWKDLRDFIRDRVKLPWDEFNRVPVAGLPNVGRLMEMLDGAAIALIVMTAEDERADGKTLARQNVVHEAGLFQGRLGLHRAIILLEEGCEEFSNIHGIGQIRFPAGNIVACFEEVRRVLEREGLLPT